MSTINILTLNIHKGFSTFNRRYVLHQLRESLRTADADIVFLQEVAGANQLKSGRYEAWQEPQHAYLADEFWQGSAYGKNAVHRYGHYGNAILSKFPIMREENIDISAHPSESRGMLHCEIALPEVDQPVHTLCVHLGLLRQFRLKQYESMREYIRTQIPPDAPVIVAGDFNDWNCEADHHLAHPLDLREVSRHLLGHHARTFPAFMPTLRLDRIYLRGWIALENLIHQPAEWANLSDHAPVASTVRLHP